jgi:hypothetical protein
VGAALLLDAARFRYVEQIRRFVDADAPPDVEFGFGEWVGAFVRADDLFTPLAEPTEIPGWFGPFP